MSRARDIANLVDANGDIVTSALDNVPSADLVNDTTPQLGGALDTNGNAINFGDNEKAQFGDSQDLQVYHSGSDSFIKDVGTGDLWIQADNNLYIGNNAADVGIQFASNGAATLYYDNASKLATNSSGVTVTGTVTADGLVMGDNDEIQLGDSTDFRMYHNGGNSIISDVGTGDLYLAGDNLRLTNAALSKAYARGYSGGKFEIHYDNVAKLETTSYGIDISGSVVADTDINTSAGAFPTPDMASYQNFVWTLTANASLGNPSTEKVGQTGFFVFIQDATGGRTLSLGGEYKTAGGAGITLSTAANAVDIVPYIVQTTGTILLGTPQLAFA